MRKMKTITVGVTASALAMGLAVATTGAKSADTPTTFELTGGSLTVDVPASADLTPTHQALGLTSVAGSLGAVKVTDDRGALAGSWTTTGSSTAFTNGTYSVDAASVSYTSGDITTTGTVTAVPGTGDGGSIGTARAVVTASAITGVNTATWTPTITIALGTDQVSGQYSGTITHSVA